MLSKNLIHIRSKKLDIVTKWSYIVTVRFKDTFNTKNNQRNLYDELSSVYGDVSIKWSVRWTIDGADIRFRDEKDAMSFWFFYITDYESELDEK